MTFGVKITLFIIAINSLTYFAFWFDKRAAKLKNHRISERNLLLVSLLGGSPAAIFASRKFRHKTKKQPFKSILYFIVFIQILGVILVLNNSNALAKLEAFVS